jgi:2-keto-4-pentenoate hydratase/2-oxohepta-3-ene-1,7-dioic acid hydratase in catechol pathway
VEDQLRAAACELIRPSCQCGAVRHHSFYCVGLNYLKHLKEAADKRGEVPNVPDRPAPAQSALIAHDKDVVIPAK